MSVKTLKNHVSKDVTNQRNTLLKIRGLEQMERATDYRGGPERDQINNDYGAIEGMSLERA